MTYSKLHIFKIHNLISFGKCFHWKAVPAIKIMNMSVIPQNFFLPLGNASLCLFCSQATGNLLPITLDKFAFSRVLYKWNLTICTLKGLAFFYSAKIEIHLWCFNSTIPFCCCKVAFHCMPSYNLFIHSPIDGCKSCF